MAMFCDHFCIFCIMQIYQLPSAIIAMTHCVLLLQMTQQHYKGMKTQKWLQLFFRHIKSPIELACEMEN